MLETYRGFNRCYMIEGNLWTLLSVRGKLVLQIMFNALPHPPDTPIFLFQLIWSYFLFPDQVKLPVFSKNFSPDQVHKLRNRKFVHPIQKTWVSQCGISISLQKQSKIHCKTIPFFHTFSENFSLPDIADGDWSFHLSFICHLKVYCAKISFVFLDKLLTYKYVLW